jgi:hypothetical protein
LRKTRATVIVAIASILVAVVAACAGSGGSNGGFGQAASGLTIGVSAPADGARVSIPFAVSIDSNVPLAAPETGNHHAHIYFDSVTTNTADYDIVYGNSWQVTRQLTPGKHTLIVALANPDHSLAGPQQAITVDVVAGSGGGGSAPAGTAPASAPPTISY